MSIVFLFQNMGATISYTVIIGDLLPRFVKTILRHHDHDYLFSDDSHIERALLMSIVTILIVMPLSCQKKIGFLGYMSFISIAMMIMFTILVVVKQPNVPCPINPGDKCHAELFIFEADTVLVLPTIGFSFICHTTLLPVYHELKARSLNRMLKVSRTAIVCCFVLYGLSAVFGYKSFFGQTDSDIMKSYLNYDQYNKVIQIVQVSFICAVTLTIPLICFPFRKTVTLGVLQQKELTNKQHYGITLSTNIFVLVVSILIPEIKVVFGFFGATSSVMLMFLLPSLFYKKLMGGTWMEHKGLLCMFIAGILISITALTAQFISVFG
eukprot:TRINITY_DN4684_c0_g1_i2.p1 TRINITY_DN4684_c0_g1~~TRINITY_DN4684_c0_g1_i2.p1  ORF type:complete len:324 (-),score=51.66 TRINITY_DN4684_c0_g1_i2:725-1696(-)